MTNLRHLWADCLESGIRPSSGPYARIEYGIPFLMRYSYAVKRFGTVVVSPSVADVLWLNGAR